MINLLDKTTRREIDAAQHNVTLRKYVFTLLVLMLLVAGSFGVGYIILTTQEADYRERAKAHESEKAAYANDIAAAKTYADNLKIAKTILGSEVTVSEAINIIARTLPNDVTLSTLTLETSALSKPLLLDISAPSYASAVATKNAFQESPYFKDVRFVSVEQSNGASGTYSGSLEVTIVTSEIIKQRTGAAS